jgi:hypothetical protein
MLLRLEFAKGHIGDVWIRLTEAIGFIRAQRQRAADSIGAVVWRDGRCRLTLLASVDRFSQHK